MRYTDLLTEAAAKQLTVVYGGRFQPMHQGHFNLYQKLVQRFGKDNVVIATMLSKDAHAQQLAGDYSKDPFTFKEKTYIMNKMFGITRVIDSSPYRPDITKAGRNPETSAVVLVFSAKDAGRLKGSDTIHPLPKEFKIESLESYTEDGNMKRAYLLEMPTEKGGMSATDFRKVMSSDSPEEEKQETFIKFFGKFDQEIFDFIEGRLKG
jgi:hypothetical protein